MDSEGKGLQIDEENDEVKNDLLPPNHEIFDPENGYAILNMVPFWMDERVRSRQVHEYLQMSEEEHTKLVKPGLTLKRLRVAFWREYEKVFSQSMSRLNPNRKKINPVTLTQGICAPSFFRKKVCSSDLLFSWILRPPVNYESALEEALNVGIEQMREILEMPMYTYRYDRYGKAIKDEEGNHVREPDSKIASLKMKTFALLDLRVKGSIPHRIEQNINKKVDGKVSHSHEHSKKEEPETIDVREINDVQEIDQKLEEMRREVKALINNPGEVIDARTYQDTVGDQLQGK